jgi:hypothetical protein
MAFIDHWRLENDRRLEAFVKPQHTLKTLAESVKHFQVSIDFAFETFRSKENVGSDCECYVVLARTTSGSHDVEEWRPGEPERYTVYHVENLLLCQDFSLDVTTNGYGWRGQIIKERFGPMNPKPSHPWPVNVPESSWNEMLLVLEKLSEPLSALNYLFSIVDFKAQEHDALEQAQGTIWDLKRQINDQQREIHALQDKLNHKKVQFRSLIDAGRHSWFKGSRVRKALAALASADLNSEASQ